MGRIEDLCSTKVSRYLCRWYGRLSSNVDTKGTLFKVNEYDGAESIELKEDDNWLVA